MKSAPRSLIGIAPGRLDFLGGVGDYSGSWVLELPLQATTSVSISFQQESTFQFHSDGYEEASLPLEVIRRWIESPPAFPEMLAALAEFRVPDWTRYPIGCLVLASIRKGWRPSSGLRFDVQSTVPAGVQAGSSAALAVASLRALSKLAGFTWTGTELPLLAQEVEQQIARKSCRLIDALACHHGKQGALLPILCRPDEIHAPVRLPADVLIAGWSIGEMPQTGANPCTVARAAAFMAKKILETELHERWEYLAQMPPSRFRSAGEDCLPMWVRGNAFEKNYGKTDDPLTGTNPSVNYPLRAAAQFAIEENQRCRIAAELLLGMKPARRREILAMLGEFLGQSHTGYSKMGLGRSETDEMVDAIYRLGPDRGFYGARATGRGGNGGAVVVLLDRAALPDLEQLAQKVRFRGTGAAPIIL